MTDTGKVIFGISFIFLMTTLGSSFVLLFKNKLSERSHKLIVGLSSGIMIAASIWSLLLPSIEQSASYGKLNFLPAFIGFFVGALFIALLDVVSNKLNKSGIKKEGMKKHKKIFIAMTLHNIPEGLAVGVAFGGAWAMKDPTAMALALSLAIGIGIQNIPEGTAIALPMAMATGSKVKGFLLGMLSGVVEPIAGVIGFFLAASVSAIMPWVLAFAAGAMLYVVVNELMPESQVGEGSSFGTWGAMLGFLLMMLLDVALG